MKPLTISQTYFDSVNNMISRIRDKSVENLKDITLEFIDITHDEFNFMSNKIINCGEGFYNFKEDFLQEHIHIIKIMSNGEYIGFITFEDIGDFYESDMKVSNLVTFFLEEQFRHKKITTTILFAFILLNYDNKVTMVISDPNIEMTGVIRNTVLNLINMTRTNGIEFDDKEDFIDYLGQYGIMIKMNYFSKERFESGNIKLVDNYKDYILYKIERSYSGESSINVNIGSFLKGYDDCIKKNIKPFATNCLYMISK